MMRSLRLALAVGLSLLVTLVAACTDSSTSDTPTESGNQNGQLVTPRKGGEAIYAIPVINSRLDPAIQLAYSFSPAPVMNAIYGNLMYEVAGSNEITMGFLKSFTTSDNGTTWTAELRPGLQFSDGTPFDAAAIAYNIERDADPTVGSPFVNVAKSLKLQVVDATKLQITLPEQNLAFDKVFLTCFSYIGSPTAIKAAGTDFGTKPVGAGPFMLQSGVSGQSLTLVRNPKYELYAPGQPYLDKLTFQAIPDYPHQVAALGAGQAQIAYATGQNGVNQLKSAPNTNVLSFQTGGGQGFIFNTQKPPFDDGRAREAITYAIDRTKMGPAMAAGTKHAENLFTPDSPFYDKKFDFPGQDRERAQRLFDELAAEGKPLDFTFVLFASFPDAVNAANLLVAELKKYNNVKITLDGKPSPQALSDIHSHNFQMGSDGVYISNPIPDITEYFRTGGSTNYSGWSDPKVDAAVKQLQQTSDEAKQKEAWATIQEQFLSQYPFYFAASGHIGFATSDKLVNVQTIGYGQVPLYGQLGYKQ